MKHIDILIIDDEIKFADMLGRRLSLRGITCHACYDGQSGLEWIKTHPGAVTLILLDLKLPDIYGTQVLETIKEIDPAVPVFIITGHGTREDETACLAMGASEFIHKPVNIEKLTTLLNRPRGEGT
ncbi:MAG: response regulator [Desulfotignum sp.]|nr:response regulator [Desulfotignum sp.]MCF8089901.1 response regulator [Desulfotignum sp.]MCF8135758.1 response regulator [Desulfotignum sp.]